MKSWFIAFFHLKSQRQRTLRLLFEDCWFTYFHSLMKSAFLPSKGLLCLYDKQNKTWLLVNMEFLFSCSTRREIPYLRAPMYYSLFIVLPTPHPMYYSLFIMLPHPILEKVRQYNHNSPLELPHHIYISIRLKYNLQKFGFVYANYVNEHKNSGTKSSQTKQRLKEPKTPSSTTLWISRTVFGFYMIWDLQYG